MPALFAWLYPFIDATGQRRKARYRQRLHSRRIRSGLFGRVIAPNPVEP